MLSLNAISTNPELNRGKIVCEEIIRGTRTRIYYLYITLFSLHSVLSNNTPVGKRP